MNPLVFKNEYIFVSNVLGKYFGDNFGYNVADIIKIIGWYYIKCHGVDMIIGRGSGYAILCYNNKIHSFGLDNFNGKFEDDNDGIISAEDITILECQNNRMTILTKDRLFSYSHNTNGNFELDIVDNIDDKDDMKFCNIKQMSSGSFHTIFNTNNGLYGWGDNSFGQLGFINIRINNFLTKLDFNDEVIKVDCGVYSTIIQTKNGLYGCGNNKCGQLGLNEYKNYYEFIKIDIDDVIDFSCGYYHTIIHTKNGLYGFGLNNYGQLDYCNNINIIYSQIIKISCNGYKNMILTDEWLYITGAIVSGDFACSGKKVLEVDNIMDISCGYYDIIQHKDGKLYNDYGRDLLCDDDVVINNIDNDPIDINYSYLLFVFVICGSIGLTLFI